MTDDQIKKINDSIWNLKIMCNSIKNCTDCPMNINCNEFPGDWKLIEKEEK